MAEITDELVEQLKKIADALKDSSEYSEDMNEAARMMQGSLRAVADMSAALGEQTKITSEAFTSIVKSIDELKSKTRELSADEAQINEEILKQKLKREEINTIRAASKAMAEAAKEEERLTHIRRTENLTIENLIVGKMQEQLSLSKLIGDAAGSVNKKLANAAYEYDKETGKLKERSGFGAGAARMAMAAQDASVPAITGFKNLEGVVGSLTTKLSGLLSLGVGAAGVGGILGLIVDSVQRRENFEALGQQASQAFDVIGNGGEKLAGRLAGLTRGLTASNAASEQSVASVTRAMAELGITAEEASQKIAGVKTGFGSDLIVATLSVDKAFEMADGSMAKLVGTLARDFNVSSKEAFINLTNIGTAAKEAGLNASQFMQSALGAASSLKLLNVNGLDVANMQLNLAKSMSGKFGTTFSGQFAAAGAQSAAGAVSNMSEGLSAIIGERLGLGSGIDALMAMKDPLARGNKDLKLTDVFKEMRNIASEAGSTPNEQKFFLMKAFGTDAAGSEAIMQAMDEVAKTGELSASSQKAVADGLKSESEKTSDLVRAVNLIKDGVLDIGLGLLQALVSTTKLIYAGIMEMYTKFMSIINRVGGNDTAATLYNTESTMYGYYRQGATEQLMKSKDAFATGLGKLEKGGMLGAKQFNISDTPEMAASMSLINVNDLLLAGMGPKDKFDGKQLADAIKNSMPAAQALGSLFGGIGTVVGSKDVQRTHEPNPKLQLNKP